MDRPSLSHLFQEDLYAFDSPVLVVLCRPWESYVPEEQMLLQKILTSVKVDMNTIRIVVEPSVELESLLVYSPARVLIFGSETPGDNIPFYQGTPAQGFIVIRADDLHRLDDQKKKNLWAALRQMFGPYP